MTREELEEKRAQAYYELEKISIRVNYLRSRLKPLELEQIKLRQQFKDADIALAKVKIIEAQQIKRRIKKERKEQLEKANFSSILSQAKRLSQSQLSELLSAIE